MIFGRREPHRRIYAVTNSEERKLVSGAFVVAVWGDGREVRVEFSTHPCSKGGVTLHSGFNGRTDGELRTRLIIHPGGGNVMSVSVAEASHDEPLDTDAVPGECPVLHVEDEDGRRPLGTDQAVMDLGKGREAILQVEEGFGPLRFRAGRDLTKEEMDRMLAGDVAKTASMNVCFGACNVVHVAIQRESGKILR